MARFLHGQSRGGGRLQRVTRGILRRHGWGAMATTPRRVKIAL
jgi:hypothetical protein